MPSVRGLVVEQFKCWHYSMKQSVVSFTHPFPSDLCQYWNGNYFIQMSLGFNVPQASEKLSKDDFVARFRTVHWRKKVSVCYSVSCAIRPMCQPPNSYLRK